ncbi:hypothetical protein IWZ01DRAFT_542061 [Phyllosticta capitalensis]
MGENPGLSPRTRILQESNQGTTIGEMKDIQSLKQIGNQTINNYHPNKSTDNEIDDFCKWLSPLDFSGSHERIRDKVTSGTGQRFINSEHFISWRSKRTRNLWCYGKPGTGKSSIASIVVEQIRHQDESQVAFLYLSYSESPSVKDLLGCLASQLVRQFGDSSSLPLRAKKLSREKKSHPPGLKQLEELLLGLLSASTFLVVDAMDEFDQQQSGELLKILQKIGANLFVTSRNRPAQGFEELEIEAHEEDICHYIQERCQQSNKLIRMIERDARLEQEIKDSITSKAAGIFLLAYFHVVAVERSQDPAEVREALEELPSTRNLMYENILDRINAHEKTRAYAMRTIGWIIHAIRPLKIQELRHALLIQKMNDSINKPKVNIVLDHGKLLQEPEILEFCHGLVEIDKKTTAVRFIHFSAREYFNCAAVREKEFPTFSSEMALACATYLCLTRLEKPEIKDDDNYFSVSEMDERFENENPYREEVLEYKSLLEGRTDMELYLKYSFPRPVIGGYLVVIDHISTYSDGSGTPKRLKWMSHYFKATDESYRSEVEDQIQILLENRPKRIFYDHIASSEKLEQDGFFSALPWAASLGSTRLTKHFHHQGCGTESMSKMAEFALVKASRDGDLDVVRVLVAGGVISDLTDRSIYKAFDAAVTRRNKKMLSHLISLMQEIWENQKQSKDATNLNSGLGPFRSIDPVIYLFYAT